MEGDDISTRIAREAFPDAFADRQRAVRGDFKRQSKPIERVDWDAVIGKPRQSWWARVRARVAGWLR